MGTADKLRNFAENWALHEADRLLAIEAAELIEQLQHDNAEYEIAARVVRHVYCTETAP